MGQLIIRYKRGNPEWKEVKIEIASDENQKEEVEVEEVIVDGQSFRKVEETT